MNPVEKTCTEVGELLSKEFSVGGYYTTLLEVVFYIQILNDEDTYMSISFHHEDLIGMNKYEILNKIYSYWL